MALICPTCAAKAGSGDRFCRACYTVFDSRMTSTVAAGRQRGFGGTLPAVVMLAAAIFWFAQLDPEPWAYDEGSISAAAAGAKRDLVRTWDGLTGGAPVAAAVASGAPGGAVEVGRPEQPDTPTPSKTRPLGALGRGGHADAAVEATEWKLPEKIGTPCPRRSECDAVLHLASGEHVKVRLRHVGYRTIAVEPLDKNDRALLQLSTHAEIIEAGSMPAPVPISRAGDPAPGITALPSGSPTIALPRAEEVVDV